MTFNQVVPGSSPGWLKRRPDHVRSFVLDIEFIYDRFVHVLEICADLAELADAQDLGSCAARREGSSPLVRITCISAGPRENGGPAEVFFDINADINGKTREHTFWRDWMFFKARVMEKDDRDLNYSARLLY